MNNVSDSTVVSGFIPKRDCPIFSVEDDSPLVEDIISQSKNLNEIIFCLKSFLPLEK